MVPFFTSVCVFVLFVRPFCRTRGGNYTTLYDTGWNNDSYHTKTVAEDLVHKSSVLGRALCAESPTGHTAWSESVSIMEDTGVSKGAQYTCPGFLRRRSHRSFKRYSCRNQTNAKHPLCSPPIKLTSNAMFGPYLEARTLGSETNRITRPIFPTLLPPHARPESRPGRSMKQVQWEQKHWTRILTQNPTAGLSFPRPRLGQ